MTPPKEPPTTVAKLIDGICKTADRMDQMRAALDSGEETLTPEEDSALLAALQGLRGRAGTLDFARAAQYVDHGPDRDVYYNSRGVMSTRERTPGRKAS